ncbi:MAG: DHHA1 domain-containing protein, partial [Candidatus Omnitrophica bacterium]|nr:DHHA1 domain-containing protein [Candidatus Omnitrophota bacterium]
DAVADEMRSIHDVKITILLRENEKALRVSLRSKGKINVAKVAEHYGGGGHFDVAGCYIPNNKNAVNGLFNRVKKLL